MTFKRKWRRIKPVTHFIGFRGEEYNSAIKIFGPPDYIHPRYDTSAFAEINKSDLVIFAKGDADQIIKNGPVVHR